jgi:hypothetical protein
MHKFLLQSGVKQSETRSAILKAVGLYLEERARAADKVSERPETPGTDLMPEPSAPPGEKIGEVVSMSRVPVVECVVCMDEKVSIWPRSKNCVKD